MNITNTAIEPLSAHETKILRRSFIAQIIFIALIILTGASPFITDWWITSNSLGEGMFSRASWGEYVFFGAIELVAIAALTAFVTLNIGTWRDYLSKTKLVVFGRVSTVEHRVISIGMVTTICIGDFRASDPLLPPKVGLAHIKVGDRVEISLLVNSGRVLSITLVA
ncbi:MAG: hypothetical protein LBE62_11030 [Azonexus sp.]|jgi:hypothetical protein|nr:hypothetical protein [Azonexus sp.]